MIYLADCPFRIPRFTHHSADLSTFLDSVFYIPHSSIPHFTNNLWWHGWIVFKKCPLRYEDLPSKTPDCIRKSIPIHHCWCWLFCCLNYIGNVNVSVDIIKSDYYHIYSRMSRKIYDKILTSKFGSDLYVTIRGHKIKNFLTVIHSYGVYDCTVTVQ